MAKYVSHIPPPDDETKRRFMDIALKEAQKCADSGDVPVGAVIVRGDEIVSVSHNCREEEKNALGHAEIKAIDLACQKLGGWRLWECDLYVTLEPCPMCAAAASSARIRNVFYGACDKKAGAFGGSFDLRDLPLTHKPNCEGGVLKTECSALMTDFFKTLRDNREKNE